jgi:hypothetical protein
LPGAVFIHNPVDMAARQQDLWLDAAQSELARRAGDRYSLASWSPGVWERLRSAGFSPYDAVETLLLNPASPDGSAE